MELKVTLNCTDTNPWLKMGLKQNPFPQIAKAELVAAMRQLNSLSGEPLTGPIDIRSRLTGWSEEFVELCINQYRPGEIVKFIVTFPAGKPVVVT